MAIVVEQTIPFSPETLDLQNPSRWNTLFPLLRPTVKSILTSKGQNILLDTSKSQGKKYVHIVAVGSVGNFSSKLLDDKHVTAIITETSGAGILTAADLPHTLEGAGVDVGPGVVVVRSDAGREREVIVHSPGVIEVLVQGELEQDHLLHLLGTATGGTRANPHNLAEMCKVWVKGAKTARSKFHVEKVEGKPAVLHEEGTRGFDGAKEAVERDLKAVMKEVGSGDDVVYSVHFSDVNGLSRLENYIIAGEIAGYLDSQGVNYALSHSTVLDHAELARGFSISICPLPAHFLEASPKPRKHEPIGASGAPATELSRQLSPSQAKISFDDKEVRRRIENGCKAVIEAESVITEYDTVVGDGDCGYTLRDGAKKVLSFVEGKDLSRLPETVSQLVQELEIEMGGTSGALYCIYLTALANALAGESSVPAALKNALGELCKYTNARVGDRTMMDTLIPFIDTLVESGDTQQALNRAKEGVEGTKKMEAKLGRSTYLDESATRGVPDPGAYGLLVLLEGMSK